MSDQPSPDETLIFNGLDGASGSYLLPAMTPAQISRLAQGGSLGEDVLDELKLKADQVKNPGNYEVQVEDHRDLSQTGWGIIFPYDADPAVRAALQPLVDRRREQAGDKFRLFAGEDGYRPGESKNDFLARFGMGPGPVNPEKVPYYLLIVGDPETIPYRFQYQMDVQYAVGRLHFATPEEYARYAQSVVQSESGLLLPPRAAFFGVANPDDRATAMSLENLVQPLAQMLVSKQAEWAGKALAQSPIGSRLQWEVQTILKEQATKAHLASLLAESQAPALLFSASHGLAFPNGDPRQMPHQGALVCQDWPGPEEWRNPIPEDFYFSASDLSDDENLLGTLAFFFACYGAGTPQTDEFASQIWSDQPERRTIAPHDFIASLPRRMLSLPKGGALAVVGHVDRAWGASFYWGKAGPQIQVFQDCFERLMRHGYPLGYAMEVFNERYAELSSDLSDELGELKFKKPDDRKLAQMWTANNDARNYVLLGDPAVRLRVGDSSTSQSQRPTIPEVTVTQAPAVVPPVPSIVPPIVGETTVDYGLLDNLGQARANIGASMQQFVGKLGDFLGKALDEATSLEVSTYVSEDMETVKYEGGRFTGGARLRALTRIEIDGDTLICVPEEAGEVDTTLWSIHMDMVRQAQASRTELLKTVVSAATGLVDLLKPGG